MTNKDDEKALLIQAVINVLCEEFELEPITLILDGRMGRTLGRAHLHNNTIRINTIAMNTSSIEDTVRHEVAHFVAAKRGGFGHDETWKQAAIDCGANPRPIADFDINEPKASGFRIRYECGFGCVWLSRRARTSLERGGTRCSVHRELIYKVML